MIEKYGILATINFIEQIKMTGGRGNTLSFLNFMIYCLPFLETANDAGITGGKIEPINLINIIRREIANTFSQFSSFH